MVASLVPIVIVSHGRPNRVITKAILPDGIICIPASQEVAYREHYPDSEYKIHPDSVKGLPNKRQWIYETFGDVFMIDDDISGVIDMSDPKASKVTGDRLVSIIERSWDTSKQMGVYLWGFTKAQNPAAFHKALTPFNLSGRLPGLCMGLNAGAKFWINGAGITTVDDEWIVALNAHYHRISFIDWRYGFVEDRRDRQGGAGAIRTRATEQNDVQAMLDAFGPEVVRVNREGETDRRLSEMLGFSLHIPW